FLPWVTLGVSDIDGWAKHLVYSVTPAFTQPDFESLVAVPDKIVLGRAKEGLLYYLAGQENCTIATSCSPAIIFSYGKRNLGVGANNVAQPNGATNNIDEINNHTTTNRFIQRPATLDTETQGGEIDDQVTWITIKSLYTSMKAAGSLH
ncbi:MAG: hypothetical protein ACEQSK_15685, partial [Sphingomonadaceae bacterium]